MTCQNGCKIPALTPTPAAKDCPPPPGPCKTPSYARACLPGDPMSSPPRIERAARTEHLWTRTITFVAPAIAAATVLDVLFGTFTASGSACLKSISLSINGVAIPVSIVGLSAVWDFTDLGSVDWTERVAHPCESEVLDIQTTTGRCPCDVECEGCLYPAGVGGLMQIRARFPATAVLLGQSVVLTATGTHKQTAPCCLMPLLVDELAPVKTGAGPPWLQRFE